jgi:hypothetical protein
MTNDLPLASFEQVQDSPPEKDPQRYTTLQRILTLALPVLALLWGLSLWQRGYRISPQKIHKELYQDPRQSPIKRQKFHLTYRGTKYIVQPVARYELWGLVVTTNKIGSMWDAYHTKDSVDTRDLCVIWGDNLRDDDFHRVSFKSGSWTCYFRYPGGVRFRHNQLSNNHLITDRQEIRDRIASVRQGDQIQLQGWLANYAPAQATNRWRRSSTTRNDTGNGACEVIFVRQFNILARGTPLWYALSTFALVGFVLVLLAKIVLFVLATREEHQAHPPPPRFHSR